MGVCSSKEIVEGVKAEGGIADVKHSVTFSNGVEMPTFGLGTYAMDN